MNITKKTYTDYISILPYPVLPNENTEPKDQRVGGWGWVISVLP